jgi:exonuclease III
MKIATYNVRNLYSPGTFIDSTRTDAVTEAFFNKRVSYFVEQLRPLNLDIICLQEIGGEEGVKAICDALGYLYALAKPNSRGIRVGVLYKKELAEKITAKSTPFGDLIVPSIQVRGDMVNVSAISGRRDVLVVDIEGIFSQPLRVVTFHLKSLLPEYLEDDNKETDAIAFTDAKFRAVLYKMMELRALRTFANESLKEDKSLIFLGDFNEHNNSSGLDILKSGVSEEYRLYDVLTKCDKDITTHMYRGNKITFDTLIVSQSVYECVTTVSVENHNLKDYSTLPQGAIEYEVESDHALVWVEVV